ncbi:MAG: MurR/RpiR family transcriptional regulator [Geminicoccaceae bacterium]
MRIRDRIEQRAERLTPSERQLASVLIADYPFAGLAPIQKLSGRAKVSPPSISRFVAKLGFSGFQDFQQALVQELKEGDRSPIELGRSRRPIDETAPLASYLALVDALNTEMCESLPAERFDRICTLLGDPRRRIGMIGGRMSDSIAVFFARHLAQVRENVVHIPADSESWPDHLLRLRPRDVVVIFDFRRYQPGLARLAAAVRSRKAQTVVITDQWVSPAARGASELVAVPIASGTVWDSYVPAFALVEAMMVRLAERNWEGSKDRIAAWDAMRETLVSGTEQQPAERMDA